MAGTIKHRFQSAVADAGEAGMLGPDEWNDSLVASGGTNGDLFLRNTVTADGWSLLASAAANQVLTSGGVGSAPSWSATPTLTSLTLSGLTANSFLYSGAAGALTTTVAPTNGQLLIGSTAAAPALSTITGTANRVTVTNGAGTITLSGPQDLATSSTVQFGSLGLGIAPATTLDVVANGVNQAHFGGVATHGLYVRGASNVTHYNWLIGEQVNVAAAFEITPSTAVGGTVFSTPVVVILQSGQVGVGRTPNAFLHVVKAGTTMGAVADAGLHVGEAASLNNLAQISLGYSTGATVNAPAAFGYITTSVVGNTTGDLWWATRTATTDTAPTERMRLTSAGVLLIGTTVSTSAVAGNVVLPNTFYYKGVNAAGNDTYRLIGLNASNQVVVDPSSFGVLTGNSVTIGGASGATLTLGGAPAANQSGKIILNNSNTATNWLIGSNNNVSGAFEVTPSTVAGGSTFTTPAFLLTSGGLVNIGTGTNSGGARIELWDSGGTRIWLRTQRASALARSWGFTTNQAAEGDFQIWESADNVGQPVTVRLGIASGGAVTFPSVGTTANAANAYLDNAASNNLLRSTSSLRYKTAVVPLDENLAVDFVMGLRPIRYHSLATSDPRDREYVGFGAEDVAALDDRFITRDPAGRPDWVMYQALTAPLVSVAQTHEQRIAAMQTRIENLESEIHALRARHDAD